MSPPPFHPLPPLPRRLTIDPSPAASACASKRRLVFLPGSGTTPATPSSMRRLTTEHIIQAIGRTRSIVRGETGATDAHSKRRLLDETPYTAAPNTKRRLDDDSTYPYTPTPKTSCRLPYTATPKSRRRLYSPYTLSGGLSSSKRRRAVRITAERPVEVVARIRDLTADASALDIVGTSVRVRSHDAAGGRPCIRDFTLDGVSASEEEGIEGFYGRFVRSRVEAVRAGARCTVVLYGPTGSGKSHTMFGCAAQPGIVYRALSDILGGDGAGAGVAPVHLSFLEIYNEEVFDLLPGSGGAKGPEPKVRLQVMGSQARNATCITGNEAEKMARKVVELAKRRVVKSTHSNVRSSRSHCMIIVDVPSVGGKLMLVDMAGSENIEAIGQTGNGEAKSETRNINQGNTVLKRVVESIANGDSHVPFRDSKLTMLLQDSFDDKKSKILMILCASPDPKELHKTISTLEYGARAKSITRAAYSSMPRDKMSSKDVQNARLLKNEELARLRSLMEEREAAAKEEKIRFIEENQFLRGELKTTELKVLMHQKEILALKQRLQEVEREKLHMDGIHSEK